MRALLRGGEVSGNEVQVADGNGIAHRQVFQSDSTGDKPVTTTGVTETLSVDYPVNILEIPGKNFLVIAVDNSDLQVRPEQL